MNKPTWASIVRPTSTTGAFDGYKLANLSTAIPGENEVSPMEVIVPEPPAPRSQPVASVQQESSSDLHSRKLECALEDIAKQMTVIEKEIKEKDYKFKNSYAYTRYIGEINALSEKLNCLESCESDIRRAIVLRDGTYTKSAMEIVNRIYMYLGADYISRYKSYMGYNMLYYSIEIGKSDMFYSEHGEGIRVSIEDGININYGGSNKIQVMFTIENSNMVPALEAAINTVLHGFERVYGRV